MVEVFWPRVSGQSVDSIPIAVNSVVRRHLLRQFEGTRMKILVVRQPWEWLIVHGYKDIEIVHEERIIEVLC